MPKIVFAEHPEVVQCMPDSPWDFDRIGPPFYGWDGEPLFERRRCGGFSQYRREDGGVIATPVVYGTRLAVQADQFGG